MTGLKSLIAEEKSNLIKEMSRSKSGFGPVGDVSKKSKETKEVNADEYGTEKVLEKDLNQLKAQKIKEAKLLLQLKKLRESMRVQKKKINEKAANRQLRK
jgi:hypothetical protein